MFLQTLDLTTALRPALLPDEVTLSIQEAVGLYEGKFKLPEQQQGTAYLTTHRICYVDDANPRQRSTALELKNVERHEFYAGFLKSSPKVTLYPKPDKRSSFQSRLPKVNGLGSTTSSPLRSASASPAPGPSGQYDKPSLPTASRAQTVSWICPICTQSNPLPPGFDAQTATAQTPIQPCGTCGVKPPLAHLLKAAIAGATSARRGSPMPIDSLRVPTPSPALPTRTTTTRSHRLCPRCTFENHPSLSNCEMCGATLVLGDKLEPTIQGIENLRPESPGPILEHQVLLDSDNLEPIKISFRKGNGGEKPFYEKLKHAMTQRKWLLVAAPPAPLPQHMFRNEDSPLSSGTSTPQPRAVGIAGLERLRIERQRDTEAVLSGAFDDLEALMNSAKEVIALAESLAGRSIDRTALLESDEFSDLAMTRDQVRSGGSDDIYLSDLARRLAEWLTDDKLSILKKDGGVMSLVDLFAKYNRRRAGVELISPADFAKAAKLWEKLSLPVRLRTFKSGLMVVQGSERTDDKTIAQLLDWLDDFKAVPPHAPVAWDWRAFGRGITAQEAAQRFGWSVGVATEELAMAEEKGALCREESAEGLKFWQNFFPTFDEDIDAT